jgi:hypothetical protein
MCSAIIQSLYQCSGGSGERFPIELWREIALLLPRRDLLALLFVPRAARVASQLLARRIDLHFTHNAEKSNVCQDRYVCCTNVLTRIILDPGFAGLVRWLRIFADGKDDDDVSFQSGAINTKPVW